MCYDADGQQSKTVALTGCAGTCLDLSKIFFLCVFSADWKRRGIT